MLTLSITHIKGKSIAHASRQAGKAEHNGAKQRKAKENKTYLNKRDKQTKKQPNNPSGFQPMNYKRQTDRQTDRQNKTKKKKKTRSRTKQNTR